MGQCTSNQAVVVANHKDVSMLTTGSATSTVGSTDLGGKAQNAEIVTFGKESGSSALDDTSANMTASARSDSIHTGNTRSAATKDEREEVSAAPAAPTAVPAVSPLAAPKSRGRHMRKLPDTVRHHSPVPPEKDVKGNQQQEKSSPSALTKGTPRSARPGTQVADMESSWFALSCSEDIGVFDDSYTHDQSKSRVGPASLFTSEAALEYLSRSKKDALAIHGYCFTESEAENDTDDDDDDDEEDIGDFYDSYTYDQSRVVNADVMEPLSRSKKDALGYSLGYCFSESEDENDTDDEEEEGIQ